ncbi:MAG: U32 family peptidase C-terminal domain-containing protein, partial [Exiguobacterium sp.]|nr:U32 family peptidase C-terminal domain-containing protein [Exiguobacterium sp.]
ATLEQRNHFSIGEEVEFFGPGFVRFSQVIETMEDVDGHLLESANQAMMTIRIKVDQPVATDYIMRKRKGVRARALV